MKEFHFDMGDSNSGPIGMCASVRAKDRASAVEALKAVMPDEIDVNYCRDEEPEDAEIMYLHVYFNQLPLG